MLPPRRLHSVSVWDHDANILWLSEGALGPDEQAVIVEALEVLGADSSSACHDSGLEDGRYALILPVRAPTGAVVGLAMILADCKSVGDDTLERVTAGPLRTIMQRLAVLLKPDDATSSSLTTEIPMLALDLPAAQGPARAAPRVPLSDPEVNDILEFELAPQEVAQPVRPRVNGSGRRAGDTSSEMLTLEFFSSEAPAAPPVLAFEDIPVLRAAPVEQVTRVTREAPPIPPTRTAHAAPAIVTAPVNDANLILEVLPYAKLRSGSQTRRFQVLARTSAREAQRDPAARDALILQRLFGWLAAHRSLWNSQPTSFTVNLSIATLEDERFAHKIGAALNTHGIAAESIGFEIAEALCAQRRAQVERFITQCEKLGAWVVIDDFSFDSQVLPLLRSKALRLVKFDAKLSSAALKDKLSQALVVAAVQAARVMGIHCAAKKVDTQAALHWLTAIGFDFAQGDALMSVQPLDALASSSELTLPGGAIRSS